MAWGEDVWGTDVWTNLVGVPDINASLATPGKSQQEDLLGKDLLFNGDLVVSGNGDYKLLEGELAVKQAILNRLITSPGSFAVRPEYGVGVLRYVKDKKTRSNLRKLENRIVDQLSLEARVEISQVSVEETEFGLSVLIVAKIDAREIRFSPFNFDETGLI